MGRDSKQEHIASDGSETRRRMPTTRCGKPDEVESLANLGLGNKKLQEEKVPPTLGEANSPSAGRTGLIEGTMGAYGCCNANSTGP